VAHYHCSIKTGGKGAAVDHAEYIAREGRFADEERYGPVVAKGVANMPEWAREEPAAFWRAADQYERENGNTYREFELALPRELERAHQIALVERFIESELGNNHAYQWALHEDPARDGSEQPHVHVMFSDRIQDGIERGPEQYFKRANRKNPEKGGALKRSYGVDKAAAAETYRGIRARWGEMQNLALEHHGVAARVDHRSLAEQGILDREPGVHQGPAVAGIEARGEVSEVGRRQREQVAARQAQREALVQAGLALERERLAAERVAARERRALAPLAIDAPATDRAELERLVEADRQAQVERAAEAADRRVERREAALEGAEPRQLPLFTRLVDQGRALQQRLAQTIGRVKDWVQARFRPLMGTEIQAGKAGFRAEYERHKAQDAARAQALAAGRERYAQQKAVDLARQQELERIAKEQLERQAPERDRGRGRGRSPGDEHPGSHDDTIGRKKDRGHGWER
jgi:hypothetical protein